MRYVAIILMVILLTLMVLLIPVREVRGDGGVIQMTKTADAFVITVYTASSPIRAGSTDVSVLIQNRENAEAVLNAQVWIQLRNDKGLQVTAQATHAAAQNKLLYAATVNIPEAGQWNMEVTVQQGEQTASISETITVIASRSLLLSHWQYLTLPPLIIFLFVLNQWLRRRHQLLSVVRNAQS